MLLMISTTMGLDLHYDYGIYDLPSGEIKDWSPRFGPSNPSINYWMNIPKENMSGYLPA